jgi:hypothetical protein
MSNYRCYPFRALALIALLSACTSHRLTVPTATPTITPTPLRVYRPTRTAIPNPPPPTSTVPMDDLLSIVEGRLRRVKEPPYFPLAQVVPLDIPEGRQPLWVAYTGAFSGGYQVVAVYTREAGRWRELAWHEYGYDQIGVNGRPEVTTVQITPDRVWFVYGAFAGPHGSNWSLFSFDGEQLLLQISVGNDAYNLGQIKDVNGDGVPDVVTDVSNYYLLCGSCDVTKITLQVWAWDPTVGRMVRKYLRVVPPADNGDLAAKLNNEAVRLAYAGMWKDASLLIGQAQAIGAAGRTAMADSMAWNAGIIRQHAEAMLAAIAGTRRGGAVPELNYIFYGDYDALVDVMRRTPIDELFRNPGGKAPGPLLFMTTESREAVRAALVVRPQLASAHFLMGWLAFEGHDRETARQELELAAALDPTEPFYRAAIARLSVLDSY